MKVFQKAEWEMEVVCFVLFTTTGYEKKEEEARALRVRSDSFSMAWKPGIALGHCMGEMSSFLESKKLQVRLFNCTCGMRSPTSTCLPCRLTGTHLDSSRFRVILFWARGKQNDCECTLPEERLDHSKCSFEEWGGQVHPPAGQGHSQVLQESWRLQWGKMELIGLQACWIKIKSCNF